MSQYDIKPVREEDYDAVMDLIRRTFFIDEPMNQALELCVDGKCEELEHYCEGALRDSLSFKAIDQDGNIVGAVVNGFCSKDESYDYTSLAERCPNPKFKKILYVLAKREEGANIWQRFPHEQRLIEVKIASTDPNWRKKGIMNALVKETEKAAIERGISLLRLDTSSAYSAMSAERLGFTCLHSAAYLDIKMDGQPIIVPERPHVDDRVYVKLLNV